jgi:hypothetical protein
MHQIEQEIIDKTGFTPERDYRDRQDYLAAILKATFVIPDDEFDLVSNEMRDWCNEAAVAFKAKKIIPDFDGGIYEDHSESDPMDSNVETGDVAATADEPPSSKVVPIGKKRSKKPFKAKLTGEIDDFGIAVGTKAHHVAKLFRVGTTMKEVKEQFGAAFYNLRKSLVEKGHHIEKDGEYFKLTPKAKGE